MTAARRLATSALTAALAFAAPPASAQEPVGAAALGDLVRGLGVNTRVLVIGAHPDDEDTYLISWLARGRNVETAYLSLTRGEGGQNLIGNELGFALGHIRTEELLAARRIDGGRQYFTRAVDFGFSKSLAETDSIWPHDLILKDVVTVIRAFRPHVIVSIWTGTEADGHGHHQYAGVIAKEAFVEAASSARLPSSITAGLQPWAPAKLYRLARIGSGWSISNQRVEQPNTWLFNVGEYDPLFGRSYAEIAALSRSQHSSQAMGMLQPVGTLWDGIRLDTSRVGQGSADHSIFAGIDTTWRRFSAVRGIDRARPALDSLAPAIDTARAAYDAMRPAGAVPALARVLRLSRAARSAIGCPDILVPQCRPDLADLAAALNTTVDRASRALLLAAGVVIEATSAREKVAVKDSVDVMVGVYNRGRQAIQMLGGEVLVEGERTDLGTANLTVLPDSSVRLGGRIAVEAVSYPWWLVHGTVDGVPIYDFRDEPTGIVEQLIVGEDRVRSSSVNIRLRIDGTEIVATASPIVYRYADPARGERRHPLAGVPKITTVFQNTVEYIRANAQVERMVRVEVQSAWSKPDTLNVQITVPAGMRVDSATRRVILPAFGKSSVFFTLRGRLAPGAPKIAARVTDRVGVYQQGYVEVLYDHIRPIRFFQPPETHLSAVDVNVPAALDVAYIRGAGDNVWRMLGQLDMKVRVITPENLTSLEKSSFNVLVIGPRAFEAVEGMAGSAAAIHDFARRGGTVVVQYTLDAEKPGVLPYPVTLNKPAADRVTDEKAPVRLIDSTARLLTWPNRITGADFVRWIQERGLYMPRSHDRAWTPLVATNDPGEPENTGGILVAPVGKGMFIYTTLSFFRQLPSGHPGAARLFVNLLSAGLPAPAR